MDHSDWTASQTETTVDVDGHDLSLAYRDAGSGTPVLFFHGIPTWSFLWRQITPPLESAYRTIVPDFVGYLDSARESRPSRE